MQYSNILQFAGQHNSAYPSLPGSEEILAPEITCNFFKPQKTILARELLFMIWTIRSTGFSVSLRFIIST